MGIFSKFKKRGDVIDLTKLKIKPKTQAKTSEYVELSSSKESPLGFLGSMASSSSESESTSSDSSSYSSDDTETKRRRLRVQFREMQTSIESLTNRITTIMQR